MRSGAQRRNKQSCPCHFFGLAHLEDLKPRSLFPYFIVQIPAVILNVHLYIDLILEEVPMHAENKTKGNLKIC
jgi:hypothetical protein